MLNKKQKNTPENAKDIVLLQPRMLALTTALLTITVYIFPQIWKSLKLHRQEAFFVVWKEEVRDEKLVFSNRTSALATSCAALNRL